MRIWSFAGCEYDEEEFRLWVRSRPFRLGDRVREVLQALLSAPRHECTAIELSRIWGPAGSIDSVKDAIRQLRRALAQGGVENEVIATIRAVGFRIISPVAVRAYELRELLSSLRRNAAAPLLPGWQLELPLEPGPRPLVWQIKGAEMQVRVAKYATDTARRAALRREVRAWEALERGLPSQKCFVRIFSSHLTTRPCYIESEYGGLNLIAWSEAQHTQNGLSREVCLEIMADLADAVADAHVLGIMHNDLKPANVLISPSQGASKQWQVKVADFGAASVARENRLALLQLGERTLQPASEGVGGTSLYHAPEIGPGIISTPAADVYALGVILFQLLCGDFGKTPYPGWEDQIGEPILQEDIEVACNVDAGRRPTARLLAQRLRSVDQRRMDLLAQQARRRDAKRMEEQLALIHARRPWIIAASLLLVLGACISLVLYRRAVHQRDLAESINTFLAEDLITRANPYKTGVNAETLVDAIKLASPSIDHRFAGEPLVAARLHQTIATALDRRMDYPDADRQYAEAAALFARAEGKPSADAVITQMQRAAMHARDTAIGSLDQTKAIYAGQQPTISAMKRPPAELPVWVDYAHGLILMFGGDLKGAVPIFGEGVRAAEALPHPKIVITLTMKQLLAVSETRSGQGDKAEALIRQMMETVERLHYTDKPNFINLEVNLAQAFLSEQKDKEAVDEVNRVYPALVQQMGEKNALSLTAVGVRAQAESNLGRWEDATRDILTVHRIAPENDILMRAGSLSDAALYQCRAGHSTEGAATAHEALTFSGRLIANKGAESSLNFSLATCLLGLGQVDAANALLEKVDVVALSQTFADPDFLVDYELTKAEIAFRKKDDETSRKYMQMAQPLCNQERLAPFRKTWCGRLLTELSN